MTRYEVGAAILAAREDQRMEPPTRRELVAFRAGMLEAAKVCDVIPRAHTYASENADAYRAFDNGVSMCARAIRAAADSIK